MSFVGVDIGASSTRYASNNGEINELSNSIIHLPDNNTSLISIDTDDIESCLEVKITKHEPEQKTVVQTQNLDFFPANVLVGIMAEKARGTAERPSVHVAKHKQRNNFISAVLACAVSKIKYNIDENIDMYIAVPPSETNGNIAEKEFQARLIGTYTVEFPKYAGGTAVTFRINSIKVYAESFMAATSYFFDMSGRVRDKARNFLTGTVLSLDIGASTTDMSIIKQGRFMDSSGRTIHYGGNTARENLGNSIDIEYNINFKSEDLDRVMAEGRIQMGNGWADASAMVNLAKQELANAIVADVESYFNRIQMPLQLINAVIVSGGGSLQSQYANENGEIVKTAEPMSYFVTEKLTSWSAGTVVVSYGEDARFANVKGLYIRAKIDELKNQQAQAQAQSVQPQVQQTVAPQTSVQPAQPVTPVQPVQNVVPVQSVQPTVPSDATAQTPVTTQTNQPAQQ